MTAGEGREQLSTPPARRREVSFSHEAIFALGVAALGYAAAFMSGVVTARALGASGKGILTLFLTTVAGLSAISGLGIGQGQIYHAAKEPAKLQFFMPHAVVLSLLLGGVSAALYLLVGGRLGQTTVMNQLGVQGLFIVLVAVPVTSFVMYQRQYLLTIGRFTLAKAIGSVSAAAPMMAVAGAYVFGRSVTLGNVIAGVVLIYCILAIVSQVAMPAPFWRSGFSLPYMKESLSFGIRQWASEVTHFLTARLDFFLVAWLLGDSALGIYSVAVGLAEIVSRLAYELGTMMFPAVAAGSLRPGQAAVLLRTSLAVAATMALVLGGLARPLVVGLYGPSFGEAVGVLEVLLVGTVAWSAAQILWLYASGAGRLEFVLVVLGGATTLDVALNLALLPRLGILGAGIAATLSYCMAAAALSLLFCRREGCTLGEALFVRIGDLRRLGRLLSDILNRFRARLGPQEQM